ncbi:murein biosynthesis integral membrane protein MurJ [Candidatus Falkowbacteria bacterium]|nr:murein biosynthesis integral membrane protein MurJ [Candidatus Falkowbacteria bacterium]
MITKLLNGQSKTITSAAVIIGGAALVSRALGVLRDRILAAEFGAGQTLDIYYAAFRIPDLVYNLLVLGALSAGFIPVFLKYVKSDEDEWRLVSGILNIVVVAILLISVVLVVFTPWLVPLIAPGFDPAATDLTVALTRIMFLSPLLLSISAVFGGILQSFKKFFVYSLAPILYNVGIMIGALFFVDWWGIYGLAYGVVFGAFLHMIVQLPAVRQSGWRYAAVVDWHSPGLREIITLMIPRTLGLAMSQLNLVVINSIASTLTVGSIAVFNLANNLQGFPIGIFSVSFAIAAFPAMSAAVAREDRAGLITSFSETARQILFFIIPLSAFLLVLRAQIVRVLLGAGQFDWTATILTADALALFCLSLFAQGLIPLLARAFYSIHNTMIPFVIGLCSAGLNIVLALYFSAHSFTLFNLEIAGVAGLALAFSLSSIVNMALLWVALRIKLRQSLQEGRLLFSVLKISVATVAMGLTIQSFKYLIEPYTGTATFVGIGTQGFISGFLGLAVFVFVSLLLRSAEMLTFIASLKKRFLKNKEVVPELEEEL